MLDNLEQACEVADFQIPKTRAEGVLKRLGLAYTHFRKQAERMRKNG
jgi:hypothetical protein